jgi:hypothetical protein
LSGVGARFTVLANGGRMVDAWRLESGRVVDVRRCVEH